jgi:hypothetical protein
MGWVGRRDGDRDRYARPLPCQGVRRVIPPRGACWVVMQMSERGPGDRPRSGRPLVEVMEPTDLRDGHQAPEFGRMHLAGLGTVVVAGGGKSRGPMARDAVGLAILPAPPDDAQPGPGQDPDGVGMIAAARAGPGVDGGRPRRGMPRVIGEGRDGLTEALVARPAEDHGPMLPGRAGDGGGPGLRGQLFSGGEAGPVIAEFGEELGRIDLSTPGEALDDGRSARRDGRPGRR